MLYGQVQKSYRRRKLVRVKHVIRLGTGAAFKEALQALGLSGRVNTAFIERVNLTIRRGVAGLARRTWATAWQALHLEAHLEWWLAYYHFVRPHGSLRVLVQTPAGETSPRRPRYRQRTPAIAAGCTTQAVEDTAPPQLSFASAPWVRRHGKPEARYSWPREGCYPGEKVT